MNNQRVIKFRVWDSETKTWLHENGIEDTTIRYDGTIFPFGNGCSTDYWPNRFVIQQFTGLQNISGRDVYEGDILNTKAARWEVVFENGAFVGKVIASGVFDIGHTLPLSTILEHAIPMGNVCENPN